MHQWGKRSWLTGAAMIPTVVAFSVAGGHLSQIPLAVWLLLFASALIFFLLILRLAARKELRHENGK